MNLPRFSSPGSPPTPEEVELLAESDDAWARLAKRIGADALVAVLEEFGGQRQYIPARSAFFERLYRPRRDRLVGELLGEGLSQDEVADRLGVSQGLVSKIKGRLAAGKSNP